MEKAIDETNRRREKQVAYNIEHGVDPQPLRKKIADITEHARPRGRGHRGAARRLAGTGQRRAAGKAPVAGLALAGATPARHAHGLAGLPRADLADLIQQLTDQMHAAAAELQFELAARLRDEIGDLKKELRQMTAATG